MADTYKVLVERTKTIVIQPFSYSVLIVLTNEIEGSVEKHKKMFPCDQDVAGENVQALHVFHPTRPFSMIVLDFDADFNTVAHEAFHVVWRVMEYIGARHENEVMAYMLGFVVEHVQRFMVKTGFPDIPEIPAGVINELQDPKIQEKLNDGKQVILGKTLA